MTTNSNHPAIPAGEQDERAAFEAWHQAEMWAGDYDPEFGDAYAYVIDDDGYYCDLDTQRAWRGWQARARMAAPAAGDAREGDPLQGAANWLVQAHSQPCPTVLSACLMIGYNRAQRLYDAAIAAQQGEGGAA